MCNIKVWSVKETHIVYRWQVCGGTQELFMRTVVDGEKLFFCYGLDGPQPPARGRDTVHVRPDFTSLFYTLVVALVSTSTVQPV